MNRETVSFEKLYEYTNSGWFVAWLGKEGDFLFVDFFANWRLPDNRVLFVRCEYSDRRLVEVEIWLASVRKQWSREIAKWEKSLLPEIGR